MFGVPLYALDRGLEIFMTVKKHEVGGKLDRRKGPPIHKIGALKLPETQFCRLDNDIPVYWLSMGTQPVMRLELVFATGRPYETKKLVSRVTGGMLREGTWQRDAASIAEAFDFYGSTCSVFVNLDFTQVVLYCLSKHFEVVLPVVAEILLEPSFPEKELENNLRQNKQRLLIELAKSDTIAYRAITEAIYGEEHPYGWNSVPEHYNDLVREDLVHHHRQMYVNNNCTVFMSGLLPDNAISLLNRYLGQKMPAGELVVPRVPEPLAEPKSIFIGLPESHQTAIRVGRRLFNRHHEDYNGMYVLNTILGGYFSSRLMTNIREEKGYTYNIYSSVDVMLFDGYLTIAGEVGNGFVGATLDEIYKELEVLRSEPVKKDELEMVKSYLLGNILTMLDGPFNVMDVSKSLVLDGLETTHFDGLVESIRNVTASELQALANKYLQKEAMWEVVVGHNR